MLTATEVREDLLDAPTPPFPSQVGRANPREKYL
jgi:hypothetical protein